MTITDLLNSTKPIIYETGVAEYPYAFAGTCFPVRYGPDLYIVSAEHCYSNRMIDAKQTMYLSPTDGKTAFSYDLQTRASNPSVGDTRHYDQVVLRVAHSKHTQDDINKVSAIDLSNPQNSRLPTTGNVIDIALRGYPFDAPKHAIDYDERTITTQAFTTNGCLTTTAMPFPFCYYIKFLTPVPDGMSPNGMSGSPLYGVTPSRNAVFCGMVIEFNSLTREYLAIGPEVLVNSLRQLSLDRDRDAPC